MNTKLRTIFTEHGWLAIVVFALLAFAGYQTFYIFDTYAEEVPTKNSVSPQADESTKNDSKLNHNLKPDYGRYYDFPAYNTLDPFQEMAIFREQMDRIFNDTFSRFRRSPGFAVKDDSTFSPRMDIGQGKDSYTIKMDIPGVEKSDIKVKLKGRLLTISGKREEIVEDDQNNQQFQTERRFGAFERVFSLPGPVKPDQVKADYKNGVLTLTIPKSEPKQDEFEVKVN